MMYIAIVSTVLGVTIMALAVIAIEYYYRWRNVEREWSEKKERWKELCDMHKLHIAFCELRCKIAESQLRKEIDTSE